MDALNFLKFWRNATMTTTTTPSTNFPHLVVETDSESDEEDSFFDLELTLHDLDNRENKTDQDPKVQTSSETKAPCSKHEVTSKTAKISDDSEVDVVQTKTEHSLSPSEPISKRKVLPIEPISKPQSPIALLKSAPSFRIFMFKKHKRISTEKTEDPVKTGYNNGKKENKVFALKLSVEEDYQCYSAPVLSRVNSTRSFGSKVRSNGGSDEPKQERSSKEALQKYLKLIKPLYVKVSKRYGEKVRFSGDGSTVTASPSSSPAASSVPSRKEKQSGGFPAGMRGVSRHLGKSRSSPAVVAVTSPANRSDDTLLQQHDGIQSAILHCKRSLNSRDSSMALCEEGSIHSLRNSFEDNQSLTV